MRTRAPPAPHSLQCRRALLGAAAVIFSMYRAVSREVARQRAEAEAAAAGSAGGRGRAAAPAGAAAAGAAGAGDPGEQVLSAALMLVTWVLVGYTRCLPILLLGAVAALAAVLVHCGLRRAPSEYRHRGRAPLGFTLAQLLGRGARRRLWRGGGGWAGWGQPSKARVAPPPCCSVAS